MNNNSNKQFLLSVIGIAILVVAVVGVSFAFFNYSRTGTEVNGLTVGSINFTGNVSGIQLNNAFPVSDVTAAATNVSTADVAIVTVTISGNTTYANGIDFTVTAVPETGNDLDSDLITTSVTTSNLTGATIKESATTLKSGTQSTVLVSGNIPNKTTITNGTITIKLYVSNADVLISDTPTDAGTIAYADGREIISTSAWNAKKYSFKIDIWAVQGTGA